MQKKQAIKNWTVGRQICCSLYTAQSLPLADKAEVANSSLPNLPVDIHGSLGCHVGCSYTSHLWSCSVDSHSHADGWYVMRNPDHSLTKTKCMIPSSFTLVSHLSIDVPTCLECTSRHSFSSNSLDSKSSNVAR